MLLLKRVGLGLVFLCVGASAFAQRPERNSFLNAKVTSASALIAQMKSDPVVRDRFLRHYAMSLDEIESYFATFRIATLKKPGLFLVYGVPAGGAIHGTPHNLKKGSMVFIDVTGAPVMRLYCGNPMTLGPRDPLADNDAEAEVVGRSETTLHELDASEQPSSADIAAEAVDLEPTISPVPDAPMVTPGPQPQTTVQGIEAPQITLSGPGTNLGNFLPALLLLTPLPRNSPPPPLIPEPATMAALLIGLGGLMMKRKA